MRFLKWHFFSIKSILFYGFCLMLFSFVYFGAPEELPYTWFILLPVSLWFIGSLVYFKKYKL